MLFERAGADGHFFCFAGWAIIRFYELGNNLFYDSTTMFYTSVFLSKISFYNICFAGVNRDECHDVTGNVLLYYLLQIILLGLLYFKTIQRFTALIVMQP